MCIAESWNGTSSKFPSISDSDGEWRSESLVIRSPLATIFEGKEIKLKFSEVEENGYEESTFGDDEVETSH